jgi:hypothetical protein
MTEHPDRDLLADLAADVLPADLGRRVEDHVMSCEICAGVLADAESVRAMLQQSEPEAMPDEVWVRLERAMNTARSEDQARRAPARDRDTAATQIRRAVPSSPETGATRSIRRVQASGPAPGTGRLASIGADPPPTGRLNRMNRPETRARRQAIEEQKADKPSVLSRFAPVLRIAAAVIVVAGLGVGVLHFVQSRSTGESAASGSSADGSSVPLLAPIQSTNTNYDKDDLKGQVKTLLSSSQKLSLAAGSPTASTQREAAASPKAAPNASKSTTTTGQQLLRSPAALQACLKAIGADQQPVAVDLARYNDQEAAIIVLPADGGGYVVNVVARDCRPGADGTIDVVTLKNP